MQMALDFNNPSSEYDVDHAEKATNRIKKLNELLNRAKHSYYMLDSEIMSNAEYDELLDELQKLERLHGVVFANSPTETVGYPVVSKLSKLAHDVPLLSLEKTKGVNRLLQVAQNNKCVLSLKLDGLSLIVTYDKGVLQSIGTRGDGSVGEDVTHNAQAVAGLPSRIPYQKKLYVLGEGLVKNSEFKRINSSLPPEEKYSNPRNLAAGSIRQLESKVAAKRGLSLVVFKVIAPEKKFAFKSDSLAWVETLGFEIVTHSLVTADNLVEAVKRFEIYVYTSNLPLDGLVLTIDDVEVSKRMGTTSRYPKDSISFKWDDQVEKTKLLDVYWQTGRTGVITPVAVFEPVNIDGKEITKASLHNISQVERLRIGIGDSIMVYMANTVIPQVYKSNTCSDTLTVPERCSECGGPAEIQKPKDAKILVCMSPDCPAKLVQKLKHFASREAMNIDGISEMTFDQLVDAEIIRDLPDIYRLATYREEVVAMPGFGDKSFKNMIESITQSRQNVELWRFVYSLGIKHVGRTASKALCKHFGNDIDAILGASESSLRRVDYFGEKLAKVTHEYFADDESRKMIQELLSFIEIRKGCECAIGGLAGKTFVVTGKVQNFPNRAAIRAFIEQNGGSFGTSITKDTDYLVTNDPYSGSNKNCKAQKIGVAIISESDLIEMV